MKHHKEVVFSNWLIAILLNHPCRHASSPWNPRIFSSNFTLEPPSCWGNPTCRIHLLSGKWDHLSMAFFACKVVLFWVSPGHWRNSFVSLGCEAFWVFFVFLVRGWLGLYIFFARSWVTIVTRVSLWRVSKLCFLFYDWVLRPSSPSCVTCAGGLRLNGFQSLQRVPVVARCGGDGIGKNSRLDSCLRMIKVGVS